MSGAPRPPADRVLDNFLREMVKLGMLERLPDQGPGYYGLVQNLHFLYFLTRVSQPGT